MFALGIEFLTGTAVMTATASREAAEWPPHPARVFMALVAAHYETRPLADDGEDAAAAWSLERAALEWLEQQGAPQISHHPATPRVVSTVYVPVNDQAIRKGVSPEHGPFNGSSLPSLRHRIDRTFPAVHVGCGEPKFFVHLVWSTVELPAELTCAMEQLAAKVTRIGHSSSLVRLWVAAPDSIPSPTLVPVAEKSRKRATHNFRSISQGLLSELDRRFNADEIEAFFTLSEQIETTTGKTKTAAKEAFRNRFGEEWKKGSTPPVRLRPSVGKTDAYTTAAHTDRRIVETVFDPELLILTKYEGRILGLEATNLLLDLLRGTLLCGTESAPEWFTGHQIDGRPSEQPHLALVPLAYVGTEHADGHIMGLALAFPRHVNEEERATQLRRILFDERGIERELTLKTRSLGNWSLRREDRSCPPNTLRSETWTAGSNVWASVTPVVLDRHPKHDPHKERGAWRTEVTTSVVESCRRIGLPPPVAVDVDYTSWHRGAPRSRPGPGGMPWLASKNGAPRQQVHVLLQFEDEVQGPVLLGAGRYRGYGVCKPLGFPSR